MFEEKKPKNWSNSYWNQINRNIGLISFSDQEQLRTTPIAILGLGGLGGPLTEQLVRAGCENLIIYDYDKFEESNLNRQSCTRKDIGKQKADFIEEYIKEINPVVNVRKYYDVNENNISEILNKVKIVALTLDDPFTSILISRECYKYNIPMIESWGFPYICAWWFNKDSIDYETCYGFITHTATFKQIKESNNLKLNIKEALLSKVFQFPGIEEICNREPGSLKGMKSGELPLRSFAPMIRMTASYLAFEITYTGILKLKKMILAPKVVGFDYIKMKSFTFSFLS